MAGRIGALGLGSDWLRRTPGSRALGITPTGAVALRDALGLTRWQYVLQDGDTP